MELPNATRRRNDKLMAAIHEATRAQLAERGYAWPQPNLSRIACLVHESSCATLS
jgi:hypothetical protein